MRFWPAAARQTVVFLSVIFGSSPTSAEDQDPYALEPGPIVGTPYRAYRAGIGHTEATPSNRRPLDGSLRSAPFDDTSYTLPKAVADWSGTYFGATVGGAMATTDLNGAINNSIDANSYVFSGHVGSNYQIGSVVFGPELDVSLMDAGDSAQTAGGVAKTNTDWLGSARLRAGYTVNNFLFYGTAGLGLTTTDTEISGLGFTVKSQDFHTGYVVGGGAEMVIVDGVNARVEAMHYGFSGDTFSTPAGRSDLDLDVTTVRAGVSLKFK